MSDPPTRYGATVHDRAGTGFRLFVVVVSAAVLVWAVPRMLQRSLPSSDPATFTIQVPSTIHADGSLHADIYLSRVVADGQDIPLPRLDRSGAWNDVGFALIHQNSAEPASITVRGRTVTACFLPTPESRHIRFDGPALSGVLFDIDVRRHPRVRVACASLSEGRMLEGTLAGVGWRASATFLVILLATVWWRPWKNSTSLAAWAALHVGILHVLVWLHQGIGFNLDGPAYVDGIKSFFSGTVVHFPPGYSMFLAPWWLLPDAWAGFTAVGVQHACMVAALVALGSLAAPFLGRDLATLSLVLTGSVMPTLFLPQMIFSENVALCGMIGALWLASRPGEGHALRRDVFAGGLAGWAGLARILPIAVVVLPLLLLHLTRRDFRQALRRTGRTVMVGVALMAAVASWNFVRSGRFALSNSWGMHVYDRVVTEQGALDPNGVATQELLERLGRRSLRGVPFWEILPDLQAQGVPYDRIVSLLGAVGLEGIRKDPVEFALYSLDLSQRLYRAEPSNQLWLHPDDSIRAFSSPMPLSARSASLLWWYDLQTAFSAIWPIALWAPLLGLLMLPLLKARLDFLALLAVPVLYLLALAQIEQFVERFVLAVLPFALMLVPTPLAALLNWWGVLGDGT